jgi:tetratricopeptide (TPR) repeat protein
MEAIIETDPSIKKIKKFYSRIRSHIEELSLLPKERATPIADKLKGIDDEAKYGLISHRQLRLLLNAYDQNPDEPLKCDKIEAGNLAKLLFSKASFHNPSSTDYLVEDLRINDFGRNSFLGGHSTYATSEENKLSHLRECQRKMYLTERVKVVSAEMDQLLKTQTRLTPAIDKSIDELLVSGPNNSDVLIVIGKRSLVQKRYDLAIEQLKNALDKDCANVELARQNLSEALFKKGLMHFQKEEHEKASECFNESLQNDPEHQGSRLHLELVQKKMMQKVPRRFGTADTTRLYQRRR